MIYGIHIYYDQQHYHLHQRYDADWQKFRSLNQARKWVKAPISGNSYRSIYQMPRCWRQPSQKELIRLKNIFRRESMNSVLITQIMKIGKELSPYSDEELFVQEIMYQ